MDSLARYYTQDLFGMLMVNSLNQNNPETILDLGVGAGSLIRAAMNRWAAASIVAIDIDNKIINHLSDQFPDVKFYHTDGLSNELAGIINLDHGSIDLAVCNPPFLYIKDKLQHYDLFNNVGLGDCKCITKLSTDIVFLAQNLLMLKDGGELGIIVPDRLITSSECLPFRKALLNNHKVKGVIQLPNGIYSKTEATTHILLIEKGKQSERYIPLYKSDLNGKSVDCVYAPIDTLLNRMDFVFHKYEFERKGRKYINLGAIEVEIKRGNQSRKELITNNVKHIHTSDLINQSLELANFIKASTKFKSYVFAEPGDILISRVGSRVLGRFSIIKAGKLPISDCVFRIRIPSPYKEDFFKKLGSPEGIEWFKAISHGVCAKFLNKEDIKTFPLYAIS